MRYIDSKSIQTFDVTEGFIDVHTLYIELSKSDSYLSKIGDSVGDGFQSLKVFILGLFSIWPYLLLVALGFFLFKKRLRKRN